MTLSLYDSLLQEKIPVESLASQNNITIYGCGVTVYDDCHIGHGRVFLVYDTLIRALRQSGYTVESARNITDIDDKIIARAKQLSISCQELTQRYSRSMHDDIARLNCLDVSKEPKATSHIKQMIEIIEKLIDKGHAYVAGREVFFAIESHQDYGRLSGQKLEKLDHGSRVENRDEKKHPGDFTLWKPSKEDEPSWDSPWGPGRPGWHIECSAMIEHLFESTISIHLGGADLKFPHHENEIAQSECCFKRPLAKLWLHIGFVQVKSEKMSKSLGNFVTLKEVLKDHSANAIRLFYLMTHYRQPLSFSIESLEQAQSTYESLYQALRFVDADQTHQPCPNVIGALHQSLDDDLNIPQLMATIFSYLKKLKNLSALQKTTTALAVKKYCEDVLGLVFDYSKLEAQAPDQVYALAEQRAAHRLDKQWQEADRCRELIEEHGWLIVDTAAGFKLSKK